MITKDNLCDLLLDMGYGEVDTGVYEKNIRILTVL